MGISSVIIPTIKIKINVEKIRGLKAGKVTRIKVPFIELPHTIDCSSREGSIKRNAFVAIRNTIGDS
jgi:hypothetical protein|tara:strand:- start:60 stop:260 length:201 start_codon:yes stop_codon:yes gene_type:complete